MQPSETKHLRTESPVAENPGVKQCVWQVKRAELFVQRKLEAEHAVLGEQLSDRSELPENETGD